ncbi:MAG TPA: serine/threonine-protein kinase [Ktedonobacterales bacterium]|jgi:serine/threonine protein kinase
MLDYVGQQLGNYHLLRLLGEGGYAKVYLGQHHYLKTEAAIKIFPVFLTEQDRHAFLSEAQVMARLIHPHIVRILEGSIEQGTPFLVMDYAPNGTLRDRHPAGEQLPPEMVLDYVKHVAAALRYAHQQQLIHRDIKPGNLLLGRHQEVLLSDFGLAVAIQRSHTQPRSAVAGTVAYMAPEQIDGRPCPPSDQYSLGIVIYEWLSGTWPFLGTVSDIVAQHLKRPPPSLRARAPHLTEAIEQVVLRSLAKNPQDRFPSVQEFSSALERAILQDRPRRLIKRPSFSSTQPKVTPNLLPLYRNPAPSDDAASAASDQSAPAAPARKPRSPTPPTTPAPQESRASAALHPPPEVKPAPGTTLLIYRGHTNTVTSLAWSPKGKHLASGSWDATVQVWDIATGSRIVKYQGHTSRVTAVSWSLDKKHLASGSDDGLVQVWDAVSGQTLHTYRGHTRAITALAWSLDGTYLASAGADQTVHLWKPTSQRKPLIYKGHHAIVEIILWSADRKRITTVGRDQTVQNWDAASGGNVFMSPHNPDAPARATAWSPDGKMLASGSEDGRVTMRAAISNMLLFTYREHTQKVLVVGWSPDGACVASGSADQTVHVWQAQ